MCVRGRMCGRARTHGRHGEKVSEVSAGITDTDCQGVAVRIPLAKRIRKVSARYPRSRDNGIDDKGDDMTIRIEHLDALDLLRSLEDCSVDSLVSDPPSGISFMGKAWDRHDQYTPQTDKGRDLMRFGSALLAPWEVGFCAFIVDVFSQALRVIKPGGHGLIWALPRTSDLTALGLRVAGWEVRDSVHHIFGSGFPKSADISKAIDKAAGAEREVVGTKASLPGYREGLTGPRGVDFGYGLSNGSAKCQITAPATPAAQRWEGWGTALKPGHEVWWLIRKPVSGTIAGNVQEWGTGGINVDGCRVGTSEKPEDEGGRWPPNVLLTHDAECGADCVDGCPVEEMGAQSGERPTGDVNWAPPRLGDRRTYGTFGESFTQWSGDTGTAARYFPQFRYSPKPSRAEREAGLDHLEEAQRDEARKEGDPGGDNPRNRGAQKVKNVHPTVKSIDLMRWLTRLVTPPGGLVLDPFVGSGTTALACVHEGFDFVGSEQSAEYVKIARARVDHADPAGAQTRRAERGEAGPPTSPEGQGRLF